MIGHISGPPARTISHVLLDSTATSKGGGIIPEAGPRSRRARTTMRAGARATLPGGQAPLRHRAERVWHPASAATMHLARPADWGGFQRICRAERCARRLETTSHGGVRCRWSHWPQQLCVPRPTNSSHRPLARAGRRLRRRRDDHRVYFTEHLGLARSLRAVLTVRAQAWDGARRAESANVTPSQCQGPGTEAQSTLGSVHGIDRIARRGSGGWASGP